MYNNIILLHALIRFAYAERIIFVLDICKPSYIISIVTNINFQALFYVRK